MAQRTSPTVVDGARLRDTCGEPGGGSVKQKRNKLNIAKQRAVEGPAVTDPPVVTGDD